MNNIPHSLEEILQRCFGCKKPFLKNKRISYIDSEGYTHYNYMTNSGWKNYDKLLTVLYGLENIGVIHSVGHIVDQLDRILSEE